MNPTRPVFWYSGQFLDPQHFQQADRCQGDHLALLAALNRPWPWGVNSLELDESALAAGLLSVKRADLLFPDGVRAVVEPEREAGNAVMESRSFKTAWADRRKPFTVLVGLAKAVNRGNVAGLLPPADSAEAALPAKTGRFLASDHDEMTADRYALPHPSQPESEAPVRTLYYYLRLIWPEEARRLGAHHQFPLIRLKDQGLGPRPDPDWCPPLVRLAAEAGFLDLIRSFETRLLALVGHLAPLRPNSLFAPPPGQTSGLLSAAARTLSELRMLLSRPDGQPWEAFALLRHGLAAMSASLRSEGDLAALSGDQAFEHNDPAASLRALGEGYRRLLAVALPEVVAEILFTVEDDLLVADLTGEAEADYLSPLVVLSLEEAAEDLLADGSLLAGTPDDVREAIVRAVPALRLTPVPPPPGMPARPGLYYLEPDRKSSAWKRVLKSGRWAVAVLRGRGARPEVLAAGAKVVFIRSAGSAPAGEE